MVAGVLGPLVSFSIISTIIQFALADRAGTPRGAGLKSATELAASNGLARVLTDSAAFSGVIVVVVFATGFATEFGWGTLRNLLVRQPNRASLLMGKFAGLLDYIFVGTVLAVAGSLVTAWVMAGSESIPTAAWTSPAGTSAIISASMNLMLSAIGWASLGFFAAILLRSPGPAVGVVLAFFPLEILVNAWWDKGVRWLPGQLFSAVATGGTIHTEFDRALGLTMGYSLVAISIATFLFVRNDVTS